ncbi:NUDIX domain-containing protein [Streptomyces mirabilis]|uniref:NUDIX domain-containing protein n=1 Tax=Streptomyces mirabilis TaxID=68239 RepID=UPI0036D7E3A9
MANGNGVPEKVAWILVRDGRVLVTRSHGRDRFYFPGGHREPGESDGETLVRRSTRNCRRRSTPVPWCTSALSRSARAIRITAPSG